MYYPKSQITTNLYSNGEFVLKSTNEEYTGFYWKTISGKYYTGKTPQDDSIEELQLPSTNIVVTDDIEAANSVGSIVYQSLNKINTSGKIPPYSTNTPISSDYDMGEFTRYFCKKSNEIIYLEINKDTYTKLVNKDKTYLFQLYQPFKFQWVITGDKEKVYIANKNITRYMIEKFSFPFLNKYLKEDYLKYYK
jgi:hypothetical protein